MGQRGASSTTSAGVGQRGGKMEAGRKGERKGIDEGRGCLPSRSIWPALEGHEPFLRAPRAQGPTRICSVGVSEFAPSSHPKGVKRSAALDSCMQFRYSLTVGIGWYDTSVPPQSTPSVSSRQPVLDSRFQASLSEAPRSSKQR